MDNKGLDKPSPPGTIHHQQYGIDMNNSSDQITLKETALIHKIAANVYKTYLSALDHTPLDREELQHYGIIGLLEARQNFNANKSVPWLTFAAYRIRGEMIDHIRKLPLIRIPQDTQLKVKELKQAKKDLMDRNEDPSPQNLAELLGWSVDKVNDISSLQISTLEASTTDQHGEEDEPMAVIVADVTATPERQTLQSELVQQVQHCLEKLPTADDRLILVGRIIEGLKLRELADMFNCTAENIRIKQKKIESWMQNCLKQRGCDNTSWLHIVKK